MHKMPNRINKIMFCSNGRFKSQAGFTLVELLVVIALLGVVLAVLYNLFFFVQQSWSRSAAESRVLQDARLTIMGMEREIRQARVSRLNEDAIVFVSESSIRIYSDTTKDDIPEMIEYYLDADDALWRRVRVATNHSFPFQYDEDAEPYSEHMVISLVRNTDLFVVAEIAANDPRRSVVITILADDRVKPLTSPFQLNTTVFSRSRTID